MIRAALALLFVIAAVRITGLRITSVDGESMAPAIRTGDLVVTAELLLSLLGNRGAIVLRSERIGSPTGLLLHRVIERGEGWRRTAGDASFSPDSGIVADRDVHGVLIAVLPLSTLFDLFRIGIESAHAAFTARQSISMQVSSSSGAPLTRAGISVTGADGSGKLLPAGTATAGFLLGWAGRSVHTLYIDPVLFSQFATSNNQGIRSLARSLRVATRCRDAASTGAPWWEASDLITAEWSASSATSGRLISVDPTSWPSGLRCEVSVTLLGAIGAQAAALEIPLVWSPQ